MRWSGTCLMKLTTSWREKTAERFASLYGFYPYDKQKHDKKASVAYNVKSKKENCVKVPKIYWDLTRRGVLTMEWIEGIKLTDECGLKRASLNRRKLIDQGLYCSLRQLLEVGFFHADPHPGNLVAMANGSLAYFDFGMMGDIPRHYRVGLIQMLVHFVNRDSLGLANDFLSLGFIPEGVDIQAVSDELRASYGDGTRQTQDFQGVMNQLYDVMYEFDFSLPPDYALVIRALGSLEGTAKLLDPDFKVIESAYPFVIGRLLADPNPDMRKILRQLLIRNDGSIRWNRLERLVAAISEQASETSEETVNSEENFSNRLGWKSFNMRAVVAATEDLLLFILSEKGQRVRVFLIRDIINAVDVLLQEEVFSCIVDDDKTEARQTAETEGQAMLTRVVNGFQSLRQSIKLGPEVWTAMFFRMAVKPDVYKFSLDIISALVTHFSHRFPETSWVCISRLLHKLAESNSSKNL
ncbi:Protein kinase [Melia azedarach]|uniref:Protein kinase n=1 Tax=Melia azedarach TaxID=155640 RepID=A0ACC1X950_MELAZ|nr:Protein kinase [Melia azedarach]